jgi:hypothetical protein
MVLFGNYSLNFSFIRLTLAKYSSQDQPSAEWLMSSLAGLCKGCGSIESFQRPQPWRQATGLQRETLWARLGRANGSDRLSIGEVGALCAVSVSSARVHPRRGILGYRTGSVEAMAPLAGSVGLSNRNQRDSHHEKMDQAVRLLFGGVCRA